MNPYSDVPDAVWLILATDHDISWAKWWEPANAWGGPAEPWHESYFCDDTFVVFPVIRRDAAMLALRAFHR